MSTQKRQKFAPRWKNENNNELLVALRATHRISFMNEALSRSVKRLEDLTVIDSNLKNLTGIKDETKSAFQSFFEEKGRSRRFAEYIVLFTDNEGLENETDRYRICLAKKKSNVFVDDALDRRGEDLTSLVKQCTTLLRNWRRDVSGHIKPTL